MTAVNKPTMILGLGTTGGAACSLLSRGQYGSPIIVVDGDALTPHNGESVDTVVQHCFFPLVAPIMKAEAYASIYGVCPVMEYLDDDEAEALAIRHGVEIVIDCRDHIGGEGKPLWKRIPDYYRFAADGETFQVKRGRELGLVLGDQQGYQQQPNYLVVLSGAIALAKLMLSDGMLLTGAFIPHSAGYAPGIVAFDSLFPLLTLPNNSVSHFPSALYHGMRVSGIRFTCKKCEKPYVPYGHIPLGEGGVCLQCALEGLSISSSEDALTLNEVRRAGIRTCSCDGDAMVGGVGEEGEVMCISCIDHTNRTNFAFPEGDAEVHIDDDEVHIDDDDDDDNSTDCDNCGERMSPDDAYELECGDWVCLGCYEDGGIVSNCDACADAHNYANSTSWVFIDGARYCQDCATERINELAEEQRRRDNANES